MNLKVFWTLVSTAVMSLIFTNTSAQRGDPLQAEIKVLARSSMDSIVLRWAPMNLTSWMKGNQFGYRIERYTIVRDKKIVTKPEIKILASSLKPRPLDEWESIVKRNKYAAIAAQALYGNSFELTTQGTDIFQVVNKVRENEQRFSFALFAADMSATVSVFSGLRLTDKTVVKGEKYLYRLICVPQPGKDTLRGSVFAGPEKYDLPAPIEFTGEFKGNSVSLKWNQHYYKGIYTSFVVERSTDGKDFKTITEDPVLTLTDKGKEEDSYQYASDSLPDLSTEYYYRVRGLSPFGELGPPSEQVKGRASIVMKESPHIISSVSKENKTIKIVWEFPEELNEGLRGFQITRTDNPKQIYKPVHEQLIAKEKRTYEDVNPKQRNYYQVVAVSLSGEKLKSFVQYVQLVDSIPPLAPKGLAGKVSEVGKISISWTPNSDPDIYGYRIYKGNYKTEEFFQITREPIAQTVFTDSVNLKTLNRHIHYQVMAIDQNQNYSALSEVLSLELPDKVKPAPPVFLPIISSREGVNLQWIRSSSGDISRYDGYRKEGQVWKRIFSMNRSSVDSLYSYTDKESPEGKRYLYTIVAVDQSGNESEPVPPVTGTKILKAIKDPVVLRDPTVDRQNKKIVLRWNYEKPGVSGYEIYRAKEGQPLKLLSTIPHSSQLFEDKYISINSVYVYRVMALFSSGAKSELSKELKITY